MHINHYHPLFNNSFNASFSSNISFAVLTPSLLISGNGGHHPRKECWIINTLVIPDNAIHFLLPNNPSKDDINTIDAS